MAVQYAFGQIVTSGLVLALDAADRNSYVSGSTSWRDISSYSNTITNAGSVGPTFGSTGSIAYFDYSANLTGSAVSTYAYTDAGSALNNTLATASFTIEMWISRNTASIGLGDRESLFSNTTSATGFRFQLVSTGLAYLIGGNANAGYSEAGVGSNYLTLDGRWYQVVIIYDRQAQLGSYTVYAYANGTVQGSTSISSAASSSFVGNAGVGNPGVSIGCCSSYKGRVAKLSVYNKALTAAEIRQNYNAQKSRFGL
jgi:hypothetical protein